MDHQYQEEVRVIAERLGVDHNPGASGRTGIDRSVADLLKKLLNRELIITASSRPA